MNILFNDPFQTGLGIQTVFLIRWKIILLLDEAERYEEVWRDGGVAPRIPNLVSR